MFTDFSECYCKSSSFVFKRYQDDKANDLTDLFQYIFNHHLTSVSILYVLYVYVLYSLDQNFELLGFVASIEQLTILLILFFKPYSNVPTDAHYSVMISPHAYFSSKIFPENIYILLVYGNYQWRCLCSIFFELLSFTISREYIQFVYNS